MKSAFLLCLIIVLPIQSLFSGSEDIEKLLQGVPKTLRPQMQALLETLPEKALTLDFVISKAAESGDSFKKIESEDQRLPSIEQGTNSEFDPQVFVEGGFQNNKNEPAISFEPNSRRGWQAKSGIRSRIPSGTEIQAELSHQKSKLEFESSPSADYHYSEARIRLSQSLLKDFLGVASRYRLLSGRQEREAAEAQLMSMAQRWWMSFSEIFHDSWLAQRDVEAAESKLERRRELRRITERRLKRGTSVSTDLLQVESALTMAQHDFNNRKLKLRDRWRALIVGLYLPESFRLIDPQFIPIKLSDQSLEALQVCKSLSREALLESNKTYLASKGRALAAESRYRAQKNLSYPDLKAFGEYSISNSEPSFGSALGDTSRLKNSGWMLGLRFEMPILRRQEHFLESQAEFEAVNSSADAGLIRSEEILQFESDCDLIESRGEMIREQKEVVSRDASRETQLSRRFQIGDATVFELVQAGDDRSLSEIVLHQLEVERHLASHRVLASSGKLDARLKNLVKNVRAQP